MSAEKPALDSLRIDRSGHTTRSAPGWLWLALTLVLLVAGLAAWLVLRPKPLAVHIAAAREISDLSPGTSAGATGPRTLLNASGYVVARREATVSSKATGKVVEVLVEEGLRVNEGQILARIDASNVESNLKLAEAQVASARAGLAETRIRLDEARNEHRRIAGLARDRIASESELDRAQAAFQSLEARLSLQQAEVEVAERQVAVWRQQFEDSIIRAPFAGVVTSKNAQPGEMISPMSAGGGFTRTGICTIVDMESLEIEIDVSESYINRVEPGQPVEATLDAYSDWKIPCKVIAIVPTADRQKATVRVRVGFEKLEPRILPQMGVRVAFRGTHDPERTAAPGTAAPRGVWVPARAVLQAGDRAVVFVVASGRVERRAVTRGKDRDDRVLILAGLSAGEKVAVEALDKLQDGAKIRAIEP